jgi:signal transduction histidine kinase
MHSSCPGTPSATGSSVFEAEVPTGADGTGFGLRIVADVAAAHGRAIRVVDDVAAGGARFEFTGVTTAE